MKNLKTLDFNLLKAFDALFDERSVSKAAERLAISQPAMSGVLLRLRESFDDPLFVRVQRGVEPTNRALGLAVPIKNILKEVEQLLQIEEFNPLKAEMVVTIACTDYSLRAIIKPFLIELNRQAPNIKLATLNIDEALVPQQLEKRQIDFALTTADFQAADTHFRHLYQEKYVCAMRNNHPLAQQNRLSLADFCRYPQALFSYSGGHFRGVTDEALAELGKQRNVVLSSQHFLILPEVLQQSDLLAVVPKRLVQSLPDIYYLDPPLPIKGFTKTLVWHERTHRDPAYIWLRHLIEQCCQIYQ
ncbi:LysR family transcriptional regulator [Volucribacter psittacicida]|uniref:LysR family transcriptional regulator n=1 Tax=Volucribacter psittacicida TaxID=203482 RepID=A0A4V2PCK1_9PAST|nr:LysR family transcriptional regulator [Volucribacter psittacicida]TCK01576.1 LysR family transcriptional regulator [Volucribacter psittacicida]